MGITYLLTLAAIIILPALGLGFALRLLGKTSRSRNALLTKNWCAFPVAFVLWGSGYSGLVLWSTDATGPRSSPAAAGPSSPPTEAPANAAAAPPPPMQSPRAAAEPPPQINAIPNFPWPPPAPSSQSVIALSRFISSGASPDPASLKLGDIDASLRHALDEVGVSEASYYAVPQGFAVVTRLESIDASGTPKPEPERWGVATGVPTTFSLSSYVRILFTAPEGHYRLIVFVVTAQAFVGQSVPVSREDAERWLVAGANVLPNAIAAQQVRDGMVCTALVYEFNKVGNQDAVILRPGIPARTHLVKLGLGRLVS